MKRWIVTLALALLSTFMLQPSSLYAPPPPAPSLATLCERLFAEGARPHVFFLYSAPDLERIQTPPVLRDLRAHAFGAVVFFEQLYVHGATPTRFVDGRVGYVYRDPAGVAQSMAVLRDYGFTVIGYVHGPKCRQAGMTPYDVLELIKAFGWDGVFLDNGQVGRNPAETYDFFVRLHNLGVLIYHHCSVEPHYGRVMFRGPWATYEHWTLWGETNDSPETLRDPLWIYRVSQRTVSAAIGLYKPNTAGSPWRKDWSWLAAMPAKLIGARAAFGFHERMFKTHYYPAWLKESRRYRADPQGYVRQQKGRK